MVLAFQILGIVHIAVAALIVGGYVLFLSSNQVHPLMVWAARMQLILGLAMVGLAEGGKVLRLDHGWVGVKLVVAIAVVACCEIAAAKHRRGTSKPVLVHVALGLTLVNVLVAYAFR
ncbi:hypothetical protein [Austwickia chelonae]|uniref:hypothetical protein n=1 Tax=Austwickia chelonae TaxID=100225 RepID=UPI000E267A79|nr:hypothetical protein [Austwickia chelonae]